MPKTKTTKAPVESDQRGPDNVMNPGEPNKKQPEGKAVQSQLAGLPDLETLRLSQDFDQLSSVRKKIITIPVRKPDRQSFVRVHPDPEYRLETAVLELKEDREAFLVAPALWPELRDEIFPTVLYSAISRQGVFFLWPVRLPDEDGRHNPWHRSAMEAANQAMADWVRVAANKPLGAYEVFVAAANLPDPVWPEMAFAEALGVAFKDGFVDSMDHAAIQKLRGQI